MKRILKQIIWAAAGCFALGLSWGFWTQTERHLAMSQTPPLRVLCAENWLSDSALKDFSAQNNISIQHWTYANPGEFLRQMANADGKVDVICTSSLILRSLTNSRWLKKMPFNGLTNAKYIAVDFLHLPYDPDSEYSVPIFWNLYGFFGKGQKKDLSAAQTIKSQKVALWGDQLNVLNVLAKSGVKIEERLQDSENKNLEADMSKFMGSLTSVLQPTPAAIAAEAMIAKVDWALIPLSLVSRLLGEGSPYQFWLPTDGGTIDVGLLAIGEKSERPELAMKLIDQLISTDHALQVHKRLKAGIVHVSLNHLDSVAPLQRAEALRRFPLTRYNFPDLSVDAIPRFQKLFADRDPSNRDE